MTRIERPWAGEGDYWEVIVRDEPYEVPEITTQNVMRYLQRRYGGQGDGELSEAPENVRLVIDGREYPCDMLRDPDRDRDGLAAWVAVPRGPLPSTAENVTVRAGMLPAQSMLVFEPDLEIPGA